MINNGREMLNSSCGSEDAPRGVMVCIEGIDGAGKTTLVGRLTQWVQSLGCTSAQLTADQYSQEALAIRELQLNPAYKFDDTSLALLFTVQRYALLRQIDQLLRTVDVVFIDRWVLSTMVYQGLCGTASSELIRHLHSTIIKKNPDVGILLDLSPEAALERKLKQGGGTDRFEGRGLNWYQMISTAYKSLASPMAYSVIDASADLDTVFSQAQQICKASYTFARAIHEK
jgi:dTMP kinase